MSAVPWFMLSPSPVSLAQYAVLTWIMWGYFSRAVKYERLPRLMSLLDGFFTVALFVCITDAFWVSFTMIKWLPVHPGDLGMLIMSLSRDLAGASLFLLMLWNHFKSGALKFSFPVCFWLLICFGMQFAWFYFASSPAFTDYAYAWRHGSSIGSVIGSWMLSHWLMRVPLWIAILKTRRELLC